MNNTNSRDKGVAKLEEVVSMIQHHYEETKDYNRLMTQKFTYEDKEFNSCLVCGHSDKAIIYELEKAQSVYNEETEQTYEIPDLETQTKNELRAEIRQRAKEMLGEKQ